MSLAAASCMGVGAQLRWPKGSESRRCTLGKLSAPPLLLLAPSPFSPLLEACAAGVDGAIGLSARSSIGVASSGSAGWGSEGAAGWSLLALLVCTLAAVPRGTAMLMAACMAAAMLDPTPNGKVLPPGDDWVASSRCAAMRPKNEARIWLRCSSVTLGAKLWAKVIHSASASAGGGESGPVGVSGERAVCTGLASRPLLRLRSERIRARRMAGDMIGDPAGETTGEPPCAVPRAIGKAEAAAAAAAGAAAAAAARAAPAARATSGCSVLRSAWSLAAV